MVANSYAKYYPFGDWRVEPTAGLTDEGYTGHKHNNLGSGADDVGLIYMNARYYVPSLGRFASADTIVPDPANPQSLNRYSYVNNNPLRFTDPTGHFGICFEGGQADTVDGDGFASQICEDLAKDGAFGPSKQKKVFPNSNKGIEAARIYMFIMQKMYPDDPIVVLGYSWGGGAALEFVTFLNDHDPSIVIDALILIDPVVKGRNTIPEASLAYYISECTDVCPEEVIDDRGYYPIKTDDNGKFLVPSNVKSTLNLYAEKNAYANLLPHDYGEEDLGGVNVLNVMMVETNHCTIGYRSCILGGRYPSYESGYKQRTYFAIRGFLAESLGN